MDIRIIHGLSTDYPNEIIYPWILSEITKWVSAIRYPYGYTDDGYTDPNSTTEVHDWKYLDVKVIWSKRKCAWLRI